MAAEQARVEQIQTYVTQLETLLQGGEAENNNKKLARFRFKTFYESYDN